MRIIRYFIMLLIIIFGMTFATLNSESVTIDYYINQSSLPLSLLLVIVFAIGCLVGMVTSIWMLIKTKLINYRLRQKLESAEKSIEQLKVMPAEENA